MKTTILIKEIKNYIEWESSAPALDYTYLVTFPNGEICKLIVVSDCGDTVLLEFKFETFKFKVNREDNIRKLFFNESYLFGYKKESLDIDLPLLKEYALKTTT